MALTGTHHVRALKSALTKAKTYWPGVGSRMEVRRQALKLRFWGERHTGGVLDLTYEAIKSMSGSGVYELRLEDEIGGCRNIRVIFLEPPKDWEPSIATTLPLLWVLEAFPKRRNEFTTFDIGRFRALRAMVKERFYS